MYDTGILAAFATTASFASNLASGLNITASNILVNNDLVVNGTASFAYTKTTTGSAVIIGDAFVILNADTPAAPYAGLMVYDTGSASTASFEWNGNGDYWITVEENGDSAIVLTGLSGSKGSEVAPALNKVLKGTGNNTVADSTITDNGTLVSISASLDVTGSINQRSGSFSGSVINNITDVYAGPKVNHVISLTQAEYNAISASADVNTLYYITDAPSFVTSASYALSASYSATSTSASYALNSTSASYALTSTSASYAVNSTSASYAVNATSASFASTAANATTASYVENAVSSSYSAFALSASYSDTANSASHALNADSAISSSYASTATSASHAVASDTSVSASYASNATSASYALSASYAPVEGFPYTGSAGILGSLNVNMTGSNVGTIESGSFSGTFVTNIIPSASITQSQIEKIVTLDSGTYASLSGSSNVNDNTLYIISDTSASVIFNTEFSGSVRGEVIPLTIASNTASMDLAQGNFFTLTLVSGSNTYINPSNILPGQTVSLRVTQANPGNGTVSFPPAVKQVSGSSYVPTAGSGPIDVVTFISFDNSSLYLSNIKNLV